MRGLPAPGAIRLQRASEQDLVPVTDYRDHTVFQTDPWIRFVTAAQAAEPVFAQVLLEGHPVGRFTGLVVRRYGLRMLGSPLPGWTTSYMGFNLEPDVPRVDVLRALPAFAFEQLGCAHAEVMDRGITVTDAVATGLRHRHLESFEVDLEPSEDEILAGMTSACRRCIRKSRDVGVTVEQATDASFVDDYYSQLKDVFAKQGLTPTYGRERVTALIDELLPTGQLLLLRARDDQGRCIATGIFPAANGVMYFWGGASRRDRQILRPNEAVQWFAMRYWKANGVRRYDMGGAGEYKRKYGGRAISVPWFRSSRHPALEPARTLAQNLTIARQRARHVVGAAAAVGGDRR